MTKLATVLITMAFLAGLAWITVTEPLIPGTDDCTSRGLDEECWRRNVDARNEPRP